MGYERDEDEWDIKYSTNNTAIHKVYIWKSTSTATYFHINTYGTDGKHIFLKVSRTGNNDLLRQVQTDGCAKTVYESSVGSSSITMTEEDATFKPEADENKSKFFQTWKFSSSEPGFFGFIKYTNKKQFYNSKGEEISNPASITDTYTITKDTSPTEQTSDLYTSADYPDKVYCVINDYTTNFVDVLKTDTTSGNLKCITDDTQTVTSESDSFQPSGELPL